MNDEIAVQGKQSPTVHLVARDPIEMSAAQGSLKEFLAQKIADINGELKELDTAIAVAVKNNWDSAALDSQKRRAAVRLRFYDKTFQAVLLGYTIIPNFPIDFFAIRVSREKPKVQYVESENSWRATVGEEKPQILPVGEGRYTNPSQLVHTGNYKQNTDPQKDPNKSTTIHWIKTASFAEVEFPIMAARPEVMDAAARAMLPKVFDAIGICPPARKGDPLIIGRIIEGHSWSAKQVSFLIAWHLDLRTL